MREQAIRTALPKSGLTRLGAATPSGIRSDNGPFCHESLPYPNSAPRNPGGRALQDSLTARFQAVLDGPIRRERRRLDANQGSQTSMNCARGWQTSSELRPGSPSRTACGF